MKHQVNLDDLKSLRRKIGKSQREMSRLLGISLRAVQSYEQGWRTMPPWVQKLAMLMVFLYGQNERPKTARPCWEVLDCARDLRADCDAFQRRVADFCWLVTGHSCHGRELGSWEAKLAECRDCPVMAQWLAL
jgi:DNA-binding XRE family transcriptional regulator